MFGLYVNPLCIIWKKWREIRDREGKVYAEPFGIVAIFQRSVKSSWGVLAL
jgi:hypothetical protein